MRARGAAAHEIGTRRSPQEVASSSPASFAARRPHLALRSWAIDLIRDGVADADWRAEGGLAVWHATRRTALAAVNAGWSRAEWEAVLLEPQSALGRQVHMRSDGKSRSAQSARGAMYKAWSSAQEQAQRDPAWTPEVARSEAQNRAASVRDLCAELGPELHDYQQTLLMFAALEAESAGCTRVNIPRKATAARLGMGEKAVRIHLQRLSEVGLLRMVEQGRSRTKTQRGRSNVYELPTPAQCRDAAQAPSAGVGRVPVARPRIVEQASAATTQYEPAGLGKTQVVSAHAPNRLPGSANERRRAEAGISTAPLAAPGPGSHGRRTTDPLATPLSAERAATLRVRLAKFTQLGTGAGCHLWTGSRPGGRYGQVRPGGNLPPVGAHRAAWALVNGPIPQGLFVCHKCDNPPCVNVGHLFLGTQADNMADMVAKGRSVNGSHRPGHSRGTATRSLNVIPRANRHVRNG